jgi:site-specific recombinase XerD
MEKKELSMRDPQVGHLSGGDTGEDTGERALREAYERYLAACGIRTRGVYLSELRRFASYLADSGLSLCEAGAAEVDRYRGELVASGLARATVNNRMNRLRRFYRFARLRGYLAGANPMRELTGLHTGRTLPRAVLSVAEMGRLLSGFALRTDRDIMLAAVCELLYGSALRISEVEALGLTDISFAKQSLSIFERNTETERVVPASEASLAAVSRYTECAREALVSEADRAAGFLFPQRGRTSLRCLVNRRLARECRRLGLPVIRSHGFRHAAATHMLRAGAGLRHIQAFLGHERIGTTERYTHVVTEDLKQVLAACHPREAEA